MREIIYSVMKGHPQSNALRILYEQYSDQRAVKPSHGECLTALSFARYLLDHPEEWADAQKEAEEIERSEP